MQKLVTNHDMECSPLVELSMTSFPSVQVTNPGDEVVGGFSTMRSVVEFNGLSVVSSFMIVAPVDVLVGSVIDFSLVVVIVVTIVVGRLVGLRVTNGDLTVVEALIVGLGVVVISDGFMLIGKLVLSSTDSTENVVISMSSAESVVGSTFTIKSVGVGLGRGAFVVST